MVTTNTKPVASSFHLLTLLRSGYIAVEPIEGSDTSEVHKVGGSCQYTMHAMMYAALRDLVATPLPYDGVLTTSVDAYLCAKEYYASCLKVIDYTTVDGRTTKGVVSV